MPAPDVVYVRTKHGQPYLATRDNTYYGPVRPMKRSEWNKKRLKMLVLPKQWKHWCKANKLRLQNTHRCTSNRGEWIYLIGHGHVWRINDENMFQMGDNYETFDRWALCDIEMVSLPKSLTEFNEAVKTLIERKKQCNDD